MVDIPILIFTGMAFGLSGQFCLKLGMTQVGQVFFNPWDQFLHSLVKMALTPLVVVGLGFYVFAALLWMIVLSRVDLSFAYPFLAAGQVIVFVAAWIFLHEPPTLGRVIGSLIIVIGLLVLAKWGA